MEELFRKAIFENDEESKRLIGLKLFKNANSTWAQWFYGGNLYLTQL